MSFQIRDAEPKDCGDIVRLIKELAIYEKSGDQVHMTEEILKKDGFGEHKFYHCLVADSEIPVETDENEDSLKVVAYALFFYAYSTWDGRMIYLEDIYVTPEQRSLGIGSALIKRIAEIGLEKDCKRIHLSVLDWNTSAINYYKSKGLIDISDRDGWRMFQMDHSCMKKFVDEN